MQKPQSKPVSTKHHWLTRIQQYVFAVAVGALIVFVWVSWLQYAAYQRFESEFHTVLVLRDSIADLDQTLTVNAILMAATGDQRWEDTYRESEPLLDEALSAAHALLVHSEFVTDEAGPSNVEATSSANTELVDMEHRAISLAKAGDLATALRVLTSDEYRRAKTQYSAGLDALSANLQQHVEKTGRRVANQSFYLGLSAICILLLSGAAAILMIVENNKRTRVFQDELAENRERLELAMTSADIQLWDWNIVTGEVIFSEGFAASLGYGRTELKPHIETWRELTHPADKARAQAAIERVLTNPEMQYEDQFRLSAKDGKWISVIARGRVVVRTADGLAERMVGTFLDVTDRTRLEAQLAQSQKLESIGELAAGIAHEINTPMQFVSDNIEYLSECCERLFEVVDAYERNLLGSDAQKSWQERKDELAEITHRNRFDTIREQVPLAIGESLEGVNRVIGIVRAMKEFSHQGREEKVGVDLNNAVRSTIMISRNRWKYVAEMETDLDPDLPTLRCVPAEINQVLLNLIVNAADAVADQVGAKCETKGQITVRTCQADGCIQFEVSDTGSGIDPEIRNRIFDPFFTTKEVGKGSGQGLAICYNIIVKKHQGKIDVESELGAGTTFRVTLPVASERSTDGQLAFVAEALSETV